MIGSLLESFSLTGKVAIVTGASSGLGVAFATGLAEAGADIAICARRIEKLEQTKAKVAAIGRRCIAVRADVTNPDDCDHVVEETVGQLGKVDVLINNAGIGTAVPAPARRRTSSAASSTSTSTARTSWRKHAPARCATVPGVSSTSEASSVDHSIPAPSRVRLLQGCDHRSDPRPRAAMDRP